MHKHSASLNAFSSSYAFFGYELYVSLPLLRFDAPLTLNHLWLTASHQKSAHWRELRALNKTNRYCCDMVFLVCIWQQRIVFPSCAPHKVQPCSILANRHTKSLKGDGDEESKGDRDTPAEEKVKRKSEWNEEMTWQWPKLFQSNIGFPFHFEFIFSNSFE